MLRYAQHLAADRERPFAALRVTTMGSSRGDNTVMLSVAKHLGTPRTRPFATLRVTTEGANTGDNRRTLLTLEEHGRKVQHCHPERSEGSRCPASQTFHGVNTEWNEWAQGDNPG